LRQSAETSAARAALAELLDTPMVEDADAETQIRERALEAARLLHRHYTPLEWLDIVARIRARFNINVVEPVAVGVDDEFATETDFEALVEDGWFRAYLDYVRENEAPAQFHFGSMIACISGALARKPLIGWQAAPLYPNVYALLVGPTGTRKSTAIAKALSLARAALGDALHVLPNEGSPQGYASELMRRNLEGSPVSDGLGVASELTVMIGRDSYKEALGKWLTEWYDNMVDERTGEWSRGLRAERFALKWPYVCFIGASNMAWLRELPDSLVKAGYMPRHLVFNAMEKRHDNANPQFDEIERMALVTTLRERIIDEPVPEKMALSVDAAMYLSRWYYGRVTKQERVEQDELFAAWLSRKLPHALKVACIWQLVDGGPREELQEKWLRRAARLVDWMDAGVQDVYRALGTTGEGAASDAVMRFIERKGGRAGAMAVVRGLRNRYNKRSILDAVQTLVFAGLLVQTIDTVEGAMLIMRKGANGETR
jgi:hypothetical protein